MGDPEFDNSRRAETLGKEGGESCGWRSAFLGTSCFLKAVRPLVSGIPTMVWVLTEGQRHDRIPHPEPREPAAAEPPRNRRPALTDHSALGGHEGCPFGKSHPAEAQAPWKEVLHGWQSVSMLCGSGGGSRALPLSTMLGNTDPYSVRSSVTKGVESKGRLSAHRLPGRENLSPTPAEWKGTGLFPY